MSDWKLPWAGGCRCGAVRVQVTQPPLLSSACHCTGCQKMTGGAFSLTLTVPAEGFAVTQGETVPGGLKGPVAHHQHCDACKSWVFTRVEGMDWFVNLRATMLDEARWVVPFIEVWTSEALPAVGTGAARSYATQPDFADYEALMGGYVREGARPG